MQVFIYILLVLLLCWFIVRGLLMSRKQKTLFILAGIDSIETAGLIQNRLTCNWSIAWQDEGMKHGKHQYSGLLLISHDGLIFQADRKNHPALILVKKENNLKTYFKPEYMMQLQEVKEKGNEIEIIYRDPVEPFNLYTLQLFGIHSENLTPFFRDLTPEKESVGH